MYARSPLESIRLFHDELTALRRDLHAHPELGFEEVRTSGIVAGALEALGIEVHRGIGKTGVVGIIRGKRCDSGRMIGMRADMDALPMTEDNNFTHKSTKPGLMHACGHDGHTTVLIGAAKYLAQTRNFDGTAVLIFQPAEEGRGGAKAMMEDGLFDTFPCDAIYALHSWPGLKPGTIGVNAGPMMAAADRFEIVITGRGGHGAHPYQTVDSVVAAGHVITALQTIVARNVNPLDSAVVSVGSLQAGHPGAMGVIPREARLVGTVRSFRKSVQEMVETRIRELVHAIAAAFGATAELIYERIYPATLNTPQHANLVADIATEMIGKENVILPLFRSAPCKQAIREMVETRIRELVHAIAAAFGATAELIYERIYPATLNTPQHANLVADIATEMIGKENVRLSPEVPPQLTLVRPDDWHLHLRDGVLLEAVVVDTARQFARAIVMPNLWPPVTTTAQALAYRSRILAALAKAGGDPQAFMPLMTLYLTDNTPAAEITRAHESGHIYAVKLYPAGATTHSDAGVTDLLGKCGQVLRALEQCGMPLLVHGEATDPAIDVFDREAVFIDRVMKPLRRAYPGLKVVFEHITTKEGVDYVRDAEGPIAATITPQHMLYNRNALFMGGIRPHFYCLPILKREPHRQALVAAATSGRGTRQT
eukprot:scaffold42.g4476.t1